MSAETTKKKRKSKKAAPPPAKEPKFEYYDESDPDEDTGEVSDSQDEDYIGTAALNLFSQPSCSNASIVKESDDPEDRNCSFQLIPSKSSKRAKQQIMSPDNDEVQVINHNFSADKSTAYLAYTDKIWHPAFSYRLPSDITLDSIRRTGGEGLGRVEIGRHLMMDTSAKCGNRRVSSYILNVCNDKKDYIGQFQKMEGKIRSIRYFWKASSQPEKFVQLFLDFEKLSGRKCPFKIGQVVSFTGSNLSTLRISDVTLRRLNDILELLSENRVLVTIQRLLKTVEDKEKAGGYQFTIDKKSLMKCIKALEGEKFLRSFKTTVVSENVSNEIQLVCHPDIKDTEDPEVQQAIQDTIERYHREGRVFPHGQLRYSHKKRAEFEKAKEIAASEEPIVLENGITILDRFRIFKTLSSKATVMAKERKEEPEPESEDVNLNDTFTSMEDADETTFLTIPDPEMEELAKPVFIHTQDASELISQALMATKPVQRKVKVNVEMAQEFGYQSKAIRWFLLHEMAFHFVYGEQVPGKPHAFERFPPDQEPHEWPEKPTSEFPVYDLEESPFRYMPVQPIFKETERGWFMVQDFLRALPLSVFVLCAYIDKAVPRQLLYEFLTDPARRHTCIGDLPMIMRLPILRDKRVYRQLEHSLLSLSVFGLTRIAKNPDPKRFISPAVSVFYVSKSGRLYDTSTSQRGYANVTLPLSNYDCYDYDFNNLDDVYTYWHHLRAIVQSTPLSFRNDLNSNEVTLNRHKKYSQGLFDKTPVLRELDSTEEILPLDPCDGCAGFDSALFIHLRRHWDMNPRPTAVVSWYISRFRKQSDTLREHIEPRVNNLQTDWNSYVKSLMPSDVDLTKNKRIRASCSQVFPSTRASIAIEPKSKIRLPQSAKRNEWRKKKRPLDSVDMASESNRIHVRCRFNSKEKDMLILIRAVGFFLNPVYRFWLDPAVLRDIMHEYVPESRTKTVQSLMAAGVREMARANRLAYLQRIVRNLWTFQEMKNLRMQLAACPLNSAEAKMAFFRNAFDVANRLLFMENQALPHVSSNNVAFENFLTAGKVTIAAEQTSTNPMPIRSRKPTKLEHIHHSVAVNILLSILIHSTDGSFTEQILEQISASVIHDALQVLRSDGLVSRTRSMDPKLLVITKNQAVLSYYFRHFFAHRFHPDIVEQTYHVSTDCQLEDDVVEKYTELHGDHVGLAIVAGEAFTTHNDLVITVDDRMLQVFEEAAMEQSSQSTKQIRYLENADLRLEEVKVTFVTCGDSTPVPSVAELLNIIDRSQPVLDEIPQLANVLSRTPVEDAANLVLVYNCIQNSGIVGASIEDIAKNMKLARSAVWPFLKLLLSGYMIIDVGVDKRRWVSHDNAAAWSVVVDDRKFYPRPWSIPTGGICQSTIRWMAESCLMTVVSNPGIPLKDLHFRFEFALQPAAIDEIICILEAADCVKVCEEVFQNMTLASPFEEQAPQRMFTYVVPTVSCIQRFARIFATVPFLPSMTGSRGDDDTVPPPVKKIKIPAPDSGLTEPKVIKGL